VHQCAQSRNCGRRSTSTCQTLRQETGGTAIPTRSTTNQLWKGGHHSEVVGRPDREVVGETEKGIVLSKGRITCVTSYNMG